MMKKHKRSLEKRKKEDEKDITRIYRQNHLKNASAYSIVPLQFQILRNDEKIKPKNYQYQREGRV